MHTTFDSGATRRRSRIEKKRRRFADRRGETTYNTYVRAYRIAIPYVVVVLRRDDLIATFRSARARRTCVFLHPAGECADKKSSDSANRERNQHCVSNISRNVMYVFRLKLSAEALKACLLILRVLFDEFLSRRG